MSTAPVVGEVLFVRNHSKMHLWTMGMVNAWWKAEVEVAYLFSYVNPSAAMTGSSITSRVNILSAQPNFSTVQKHRNKRQRHHRPSHCSSTPPKLVPCLRLFRLTVPSCPTPHGMSAIANTVSAGAVNPTTKQPSNRIFSCGTQTLLPNLFKAPICKDTYRPRLTHSSIEPA